VLVKARARDGGLRCGDGPGLVGGVGEGVKSFTRAVLEMR
jgi:hypothetical protein